MQLLGQMALLIKLARSMIALEVSLNGKRVCTAGAEDLAVLNSVVPAYGLR
jgi:hypothetical protein